MVGTDKGRLQNKFGAEFEKRDFQVWVSEEVLKLPEGI